MHWILKRLNMDSFKIPMLYRFDAITHIMPYYSQTHTAFLLLSSLCSKTRNKLDEFVTCMREYWMQVWVDSNDLQNHIFLPNDLFEVILDLFDKEMIESFIEFIKNLSHSKGWHFNSHYMHSKIKIWDPVRVSPNIIKKLVPYVDLLKSIQVILYKKDEQTSKFKYESSTLDTNWK